MSTVEDLKSATTVVTAVGVASTAEAVLPGAGANGNTVLITCSTPAYLFLGATGLAAASPTVFTLYIDPSVPLFLVVPPGVTHFRVIRVAADGAMSMTLQK
jgi:hypothetical protein